MEQARQLLALAGYPEGRGLPSIEILFNTSENHKIIAEAVQQMWQTNLNVHATLLNQEEKVYFDSRQQMNYQVLNSTLDRRLQRSEVRFSISGRPTASNNLTGWSNADYDRLIAEAATTADRIARYHTFQQAEAILLGDAPVLPIYHYTHGFLIRPNVKGWYPTILDHHPYKYVHLD